ncbi:putative leucine-rich repeat domain superfamily [Helianthus annuus]|nr:putative leucine-rich repeat domain superfamily [Helianthus annuus]
MQRLKYLDLSDCHQVVKLPEELGRLECLEELHLTNCVSLRHIPNSICKMKTLLYLNLRFCTFVGKLPEELGCLECLKELNIEGVGISRLPQSIYQLIGLRIIGFREQLEVCGSTSLTKTSLVI